ncbi:MAG TPA: acetyl-CoA carboxylase biotin carboxylase subunit [Ktedonobacterales bacterium]|nr:acetyl-CoA carboxylase biotin carboxylase subunit [Ktedonobacterales bacterium]
MPDQWPFASVLIVNRGEIAVRVMRACRELGLKSVAVYSDADRAARHVRLADEAYYIGPSPARESYLNIPKLLEVARRSGAQAIHPGYGFLAENADFADACAEAGLIFVGPTGEAMRAVGEKTSARRVAQKAGVPIVPGATAGLEDAQEAARLAEKLGYPVMLKAAAGGGGMGQRIVQKPEEIETSLRAARSEAASAFGDSEVYMEKAIMPARHIEVQIIGDTHGHVVHLGERECSVQRRRQKLIEESPSVALDDDLRAQFTESAIKVAQAIGYTNAGTCEFLLGPDRQFYFLEVNTRLQVEHPVTEWRTGLDLVKEQLRVAAGLPLSFTQEEVRFRGHAIECRITAENPYNRFLPRGGTIAAYQEPGGPGVRVDSGAYAGMDVPLFYDSLLAKLITWGEDRAEAVVRLRRALEEYTIAGVSTTIPFHQFAIQHPRFLAGDLSTGWVAETWGDSGEKAALDGQAASGAPSPEAVAALAAALVDQDAGTAARRRIHPGGAQEDGERSRWRDAGRRAALQGW